MQRHTLSAMKSLRWVQRLMLDVLVMYSVLVQFYAVHWVMASSSVLLWIKQGGLQRC